MSKVTRRLVPFLIFCYFVAYVDRVNVGFAGATMSKDLNFSAAAFGGAAAGVAAVNSIGNFGGYFGPQAFGYLKTSTGGDAASLIFLACSAILGAVLVLALGHNPGLERAAVPPAA